MIKHRDYYEDRLMIASHGSWDKELSSLDIGINIRSNVYTGLIRYESATYHVMQDVISYPHSDNGVYHPST